MQRRHFLQAAGCIASGLGVGSGFALAAPVAAAREPIERNGVPKFKFSLAAYSYRSLLQGKNASMTLHDFIDDCARMGLEGSELTSYYFPEQINDAYLHKLRHHCFRLGLDVSGTAIRNDFGHEAGPQRDKEIAWVKQWIEHAVKLGAPVIRVFAGRIRGEEQASYRRIVEGLQLCSDYAGRHGVHLALENHGGPTATVEGLLNFVRDVDSPWFGVNLDTGNFHSEQIYDDLAKAAPFALNVQVKVVVHGPDKKKHPTDFKRLAGILRESGYRGYIVLEYEEGGNPREECPKYVEQLRTAFAT